MLGAPGAAFSSRPAFWAQRASWDLGGLHPSCATHKETTSSHLKVGSPPVLKPPGAGGSAGLQQVCVYKGVCVCMWVV